MELKIGELARRSALSVRTLHHYDAIGLLSPSERSEGGARIYGREDFLRLHRILVLKQVGYGLADIRRILDDSTVDPLEVIDRQIRLLEEQAQRARVLGDKLKYMSSRLSAAATVETVDWLSLLEMTTLYEQYLSQAEVQLLRAPAAGTAHDIEAQRSRLVAEVRDCMRGDEPPDSARARELAWRWVRMVIALTSNNATLAVKLKALQAQDRRARDAVGIDAGMFRWIDEAIVHARLHLFSQYLSPKQLDKLRRRQLAHIDEWPALVGMVREQMDAGTPCDAPPMLLLATRWQELFRASYCGDDREIEARVRRALSEEPDLSLGVGVDDALMQYVRAAMAAASEPNSSTKEET